MSGYTEQEASARFVGRGLAGFLQKPFTAQELLAIVSQARQRGRAG
jgi:FixJ family two-component response regulator